MKRLALLALLSLGFASACASTTLENDDGAAREVPATETDSQEPAEISTDSVVLRLALAEPWSGDPADADPASLNDVVLADLVFEGLTRLGDDGVAEPALADGWTVSEDRLVWTFELPPSLVAGDGASLDAASVKGALERVAARGPSDHAATALLAIEGWSEMMNGQTDSARGITAVDGQTLAIALAAPFEPLGEVLAAPAFGIAPVGADGSLRPTGEFRPSTDDPTRLEAVDPASSVSAIELVSHPSGARAAVADGQADWALLRAGETGAILATDTLRQPLDFQLAVVIRLPSENDRRAISSLLEPRPLADSIDGLTARTFARPVEPGFLPESVVVDVPAGTLERLGSAIADQLEAAGVSAELIVSEPGVFAARVASGDAQIFPTPLAGGFGPASAMLRLRPEGADDLFGSFSDELTALGQSISLEPDGDRRTLNAGLFERALIDEGLLVPIGQFEARVVLGREVVGLRHRPDGTMVLAGIERPADG